MNNIIQVVINIYDIYHNYGFYTFNIFISSLQQILHMIKHFYQLTATYKCVLFPTYPPTLVYCGRNKTAEINTGKVHKKE